MSPTLNLRTDPRRVTVVVPSLFTLGNLFFGIWSIVLASTGEFYRASWWIVIAGVMDLLDGKIARLSKSGTQFGAELDSLVDLVSFGVAPAVLISHLLFFDMGGFAWLFAYGYVVCVTLRLARYNLQLGEETPATFTGLPSTAGGMTLATYYPFTQTQFYQTQLAELPWSQVIIFLTIALSLAMVSNIRYAKLPRIGLRTLKGQMGLATHVLILGFGIWERDIFFFPLGIAYLSYGLIRTTVVGFLERGEERSEAGDAEQDGLEEIEPSQRRLRRVLPKD